MYNKRESKDVFDSYITKEMSLNAFLRILSIEINHGESESINSDINNKRKQLSEYLKKMGLQGVLENELNKKKQAKVFPIYQLLFFRRIFLDVNEGKDGLIKKILSKKLIEVTEYDINEFLKTLSLDFEKWNGKYSEKYKIEDVCDESELFEMFCAAEAEKEQNEEDKALLKELFGESKEDDSKILFYFEVMNQERFFLDKINRIIDNKRRLEYFEGAILNEIQSRIEEVFKLDTIINAKIDTLDRYDSVLGIINMPKSILDTADDKRVIMDRIKLFLLEDFSNEIKYLLNQWEKYIADFPVELEKERIEFVDEKTNIPPDEKRALHEVKKKNR